MVDKAVKLSESKLLDKYTAIITIFQEQTKQYKVTETTLFDFIFKAVKIVFTKNFCFSSYSCLVKFNLAWLTL